MYNGYKSQISNSQLKNQLDMIEEIKARKMAARFFGVEYDFAITQIDEIMSERISEALFMINLEFALSHECACENCKFIREEYAWIGAQKARLELEPMTTDYMFTVQESVDFETARMNRSIAGGCNVIK